jgi:hypothetical protein|tara:strand:+ start:119 stop:463 length:345 start_codon:yes stop_codon:yes gene_type:complete
MAGNAEHRVRIYLTGRTPGRAGAALDCVAIEDIASGTGLRAESVRAACVQMEEDGEIKIEGSNVSLVSGRDGRRLPVNATLPVDLVSAVDAYARKHNKTRSSLIEEGLRMRIEK